ncbi:MAG: endonuclease/exonuclease/phosphatase family protein [Paludibacter sp.]
MFGRAILKWGMLFTNFVVATIMLLTLIGTVLSPEDFILPAYFTLTFPIFIALNLGFVFFWMLARKWFFLLSLSLLLFSATEVNNTLPIHFGKTKEITANHPIHILTYNTKISGDLKKHTKRKPNKVIQYILDSNADIVCLQEFCVAEKTEFITHADMIRIFKKYPYKHIEYKFKASNFTCGIATFSKYPIVRKHKIKYPSYYNISIYSDININGKIIRLINNHLESNRLTEIDKSMPIKLKNDFTSENLTGATKEFSRKLGIAYKLRARQADIVSKVITDSPYDVIACGDLNDVPSSYAYTKLKGDLKDTFSEIGNGFGWTYNERIYHFRIDYVFYDSQAFVPISYKMDNVKYSDHYPVQCVIDINNSGNNQENSL